MYLVDSTVASWYCCRLSSTARIAAQMPSTPPTTVPSPAANSAWVRYVLFAVNRMNARYTPSSGIWQAVWHPWRLTRPPRAPSP
jgi:hypothetical protein